MCLIVSHGATLIYLQKNNLVIMAQTEHSLTNIKLI